MVWVEQVDLLLEVRGALGNREYRKWTRMDANRKDLN
jgi:hypothetical protein